jgi:hypothetical protein
MTIEQHELKNMLSYNPETGEWIWLISPANPVPALSAAGTISKHGYLVIQIKGRIYKAHRLAFLYMTGKWPLEVDHRDCNRKNCVWSNLREATRSQNRANAGLSSKNTTGFKGVVFDKKRGRWDAKIGKDKKRMYLGSFSSAMEAHAAYCEAAKTTFGDFARPG